MSVKIFIDQGHNPTGSPNAGATGNGLYEQDITYTVGKYLYDLLENNDEFEAKLSRESDSTVLGTNNSTSLQKRVQLANDWNADYFISIHTNGSVNPDSNGTEAYVYKLDTTAYYLAGYIVESITDRMGTAGRGVFARPTLYVLRKTKMPAVLIELGFISNNVDADKMSKDPYGFAYAIYKGILKFFELD